MKIRRMAPKINLNNKVVTGKEREGKKKGNVRIDSRENTVLIKSFMQSFMQSFWSKMTTSGLLKWAFSQALGFGTE